MNINFDTSSFVIVDSKIEDLHYVSTSKQNLDENAIAFIKENYDKQLTQK